MPQNCKHMFHILTKVVVQLYFTKLLLVRGAIERVILIGIDGAGSIHNRTLTPNIVSFLHSGSYCNHARVQYAANSAENWGSVLTGVVPTRHGLTYTKIETEQYAESFRYPSLFKIIHCAFPTVQTASIAGWEAINTGLVEESLPVLKYEGMDAALVRYVTKLFIPNHGNKTKFLFILLNEVDLAGHDYGFKSKEYYSAYARADWHFREIMQAIRNHGLFSTSLIFLTSDHGGGVNTTHGGTSFEETHVLLGMVGPGIPVHEFSTNEITNMDIAATTLYVLGIRVPQYFDSKIIEPKPANPHVVAFVFVVYMVACLILFITFS